MDFQQVLRRDRLYLLTGLVLLAVVYWRIVWGMSLDWAHDDDASHGFFVPLFSAYLLYMRRESLLRTPTSSSLWGLLGALAGLVLLVWGWMGAENTSQRLSLVVFVAGAALFLFGSAVFRQLQAPLFYLILMIPLPGLLYTALAFPLRQLMTRLATAALKLLGVMVMREGNIMIFPNLTLEVVNACSGLRSIMSLLALSLAFALAFENRRTVQAALVLATFPIALVTNALRVIGTGLLAQHYGAKAAEGFFHEFAGLVIFGLALLMLFGLHLLLRERRA